MKDGKTTLRELMSKGQVFAPCIYDCLSARAVELSGFKAMLLSGGALSWAMCGIPDMGLMSTDELVFATDRITTASPLPLIIDCDDGYGASSLQVFRLVRRLAEAGAMAVTIDDSTGLHGSDYMMFCEDYIHDHEVVPRELFYEKIAAAVEAVKGTDCMVIARSEALFKYGIDESIDRLIKCRALGAEVTMVIGINKLEQGKHIAERDPGWKMWPDVGVTNGKPDVELKDIEKLGFNLVTLHYTEQAAMDGMLEFGRENFKNQSSVYSATHPYDPSLSFIERWGLLVDYQRWVEIYEKCKSASEK